MQQQPDRSPDGEHRDVAVIQAELREVERHLVDVPPHHGGGRADLQQRADALRRELARAEAARTRRHEQQQSQQQ